MHNSESILENETHKVLWDFEIQPDHLISTRRPDLVIVNKNKRTCRIVNLAVSTDHRVKIKENEKKTNKKTPTKQILTSCQRTKKAMEHESDRETGCNWYTWNDPKKFGERVGGVGNRRKSRVHPNYNIVELTQNTEKSPGDLRSLAVIQTPVKDYQPTLV